LDLFVPTQLIVAAGVHVWIDSEFGEITACYNDFENET